MTGLPSIKGNKVVWAASILASSITFLIYLPALQYEFVNWDDPTYVSENLGIRTLDIEFLRRAFTEIYFSNWHPLTMISYAVDYSIWGLNPLGYHFVNIILHTANTALIAFLSVKIIGEIKQMGAPALFAAGFVPALIFGIHPIHVESVAWISERKDVLSGLFFILSALFYLSYARGKKVVPYAASILTCALALMSKPMAVTLPAVLLLLDFYPLKRLSGRKEIIACSAEKVPFVILSLFTVLMTISAQKSIASVEALPLDIRLFSAFKAYVFYLEKLFIPMGLAPFYPYPLEINPLSAPYLVSYITFGAITATCIALAFRYRAFIAAWLYFTVTLLPVIGIVQVGTQSAADRYMYLPSLAIIILLGTVVAYAIEQKARIAMVVGLVAVCTAVLSWVTIQQTSIWKDSLSLWNREITLFPNTALVGYTNRGVVLSKKGEFGTALDDFNKALAINPNYREARYNRALVYKSLGKFENALSDLDVAIMIKPGAEAYNNRGVVKKKLGDTGGATEDYRKALELSPGSAATYFNLALTLEENGDFDGAMLNAQKAADLGFKEALDYMYHLRIKKTPAFE